MAWGWRVHSLYRLYAFSNLQELKLQILRVQIMMFLQQEPLYKIMEPRRCRRNSVVKEWEPFAKFVISHLRNSCFWHEKDNVGHRTLLANFDHEQVGCVSGERRSWLTEVFNDMFTGVYEAIWCYASASGHLHPCNTIINMLGAQHVSHRNP